MHEVDVQPRHQRKGWPAIATFWLVRGNEFDQCGPRDYLFHLFHELAFASFLEAEIEIQSSLFNAMYWIALCDLLHTFLEELCRVSLN